MKKMMCLAAVIGVMSVVSLWSMQQTTLIHPGPGGSPHVLTQWTVAGANIAIEYGRPYLRGRTIGENIVPFGEVWRVGADEATTLTFDKALVFGGLTLPAGAVTLWILPTADKWQLIVNRETGQFGTDYNSDYDLGRLDMKLEKLSPPADQHTISIDPQPGGGILRVEFGAAKATIPFTVQK
jgi:hypothetical protein